MRASLVYRMGRQKAGKSCVHRLRLYVRNRANQEKIKKRMEETRHVHEAKVTGAQGGIESRASPLLFGGLDKGSGAYPDLVLRHSYLL